MMNIKLFFTIVLLILALGQITAALYLPSLPAISHEFTVTVHWVQFSISLYLFGYAASQLIYGPISDIIGRRKPLILGIAICIVGGIICTFAQSINQLIIGRFLQGLGAGAGLALARSILRDVFIGTRLAQFASYLAVGNITLMVSAPFLGGYLEHLFGWRANFVFLILYALVALFCVLWLLPETKQQLQPLKQFKLTLLANNAKTLLTSAIFLGYSGCVFFMLAGIFAWLTAGPILLQNVLGLSPIQFGWTAIAVGFAYAVGGLTNSYWVTKQGIRPMLLFGITIMLIAGINMLGLQQLGLLNLVVILIPVMLFVFGASFVFPNAFAGAFGPFPTLAGIAGALFGCLQTLGGALSSTLLAYIHDENQLPLALAFIASASLAMLMAWISKQQRN